LTINTETSEIIYQKIIDWEEATIIGRESDRTTRWIKEAVKIRQEGQDVMNRDEGMFSLPAVHVYDDLLLSAATTVATPSGESSFRKRQPEKHGCQQ